MFVGYISGSLQKFGSHNMAMLYQSQSYSEMCYKVTVLYLGSEYFECQDS